MLKFIKHHMETITGIEIFPVVSFLIFFLFFTVLLVYIWKMDKERITELSCMPLNDDEVTPIKDKR